MKRENPREKKKKTLSTQNWTNHPDLTESKALWFMLPKAKVTSADSQSLNTT